MSITLTSLDSNGNVLKRSTLSSAMIKMCPIFSFDPDHYLPGGSCKCFDKKEQARLKADREKRRIKLAKSQKGVK